jgi:molecular chaperone DnaK
MMTYQLGIDVGTTRTAAAIGRPGGGPIEVVDLGDRASAVPSVLHLGDDGTVLVGDAAERRAVSSPDHVVREFKRRIGDPTPVVVAGRAWAPEDLSAILVRWVVDRVSEREGAPPSRVAVTHPASWGAHKKERLAAALAAHGLSVAFLPEPQAAAMHYAAGERVEPGSTIAVYDLGGGTFDAAVVHKGTHGFGPLGRPEGIERLGGIDFDEIVFQHVLAGLPEAFRGLDEADPAVLSAVAAVRRECVEAKEALSSDTEVSVPVLTPAGQGSVRLHRSEFEAMIRPAVDETVSALRRAVASAGCTPAQLAAVLLVGGSSRIPLVGQLVSEQLGRPVAVDADPKHAIAKGAATALRPPATASGSVRVPAPPIGGAPVGTPPMGGAAVGTPPMGGAAIGAGTFAGSRTGASERPTTYLPAPAPPTQRITGGGLPASTPPRASAPVRPPVDVPPTAFAGVEEPEPPAPRRRPALLVGLGGALAAVLVLGTMLLLPRNTDAAAEPTTPAVQDVPISAPASESSTPETTTPESTTRETTTTKPVPVKPTTPKTTPPSTTPPTTTTAPPTTTPPATTAPVTTDAATPPVAPAVPAGP